MKRLSVSREKEEILFYGKSNKHWWPLSNFYPSRIFLDKKMWPTVEHYYQANKSLDENLIEYVRLAPHPAQAKKRAYESPLRDDWHDIKEDIMYKALYAKFTQNKICRGILLSTGDRPIHEDSPTDRYWGFRNNGKDRLGILLIKIRSNLPRGKPRGF